jgi:hypothetical protein
MLFNLFCKNCNSWENFELIDIIENILECPVCAEKIQPRHFRDILPYKLEYDDDDFVDDDDDE